MWLPLNLTSMVWMPFSLGMNLTAYLSGRRETSVSRKLKSVHVPEKSTQVRTTKYLYFPSRTFFQLGDDALVQSTGGAVDFGRHLALCAVETNRKGCWVIHLEAGLLVGADTRTVNAHTAQHTHTHRSGNTGSGSVG